MVGSFKQFGLGAISGDDRSPTAAIARIAAAGIEPFYSVAMMIRNICYDQGIFAAHDLGRPTISVGNITTGGTGKTPVVQWLAERLHAQGRRPAILLRGYGASTNGMSDEAQLLNQALNGNAPSQIPVQACPSRTDGAKVVLGQHPETDLFILDDGFQHRRAKREFNLVLISASNPFGFEHVLPRGLLREPLSGLNRADAFLITRCGQIDQSNVKQIDRQLERDHPGIVIYHCDHQHAGLWMPMTHQTLPMTVIDGQKVFLAAGIGDPASFEKQCASAGCNIMGTRWFNDHHAYSQTDVEAITIAAKRAGADRIITTEKDWVKLQNFSASFVLSIAVTRLSLLFHGDDEKRLTAQIAESLERRGGSHLI